ncbi:MAG: hypothetical protein ACLFV6_14940 [Spirulinaceae cyanobacterium]
MIKLRQFEALKGHNTEQNDKISKAQKRAIAATNISSTMLK